MNPNYGLLIPAILISISIGMNAMTKELKSEPTYVLGTGGKGASNLDLQNTILRNNSEMQLSKAALKEGMVVWDIGCGSGTMSLYLAQAVGPSGVVYACDVSPKQMAVTKDKIKAAGLRNVHFVVGNVNELDAASYQKADLVYSRLLLMHVKDPKTVVRKMASLLKSGGVLSLQESTFSAANGEGHPLVDAYYDLIISYGELKGFDYNVGKKLEKICDELGIFKKIEAYTSSYKTTHEIKSLLSARLDEMESKFINENLISKGNYDALKEKLHDLFSSSESDDIKIMRDQFHVLAYKA